MLPDRVSNLGPLTYESGALPIALRGPAETISGILPQFVLFCMHEYSFASLVRQLPPHRFHDKVLSLL